MLINALMIGGIKGNYIGIQDSLVFSCKGVIWPKTQTLGQLFGPFSRCSFLQGSVSGLNSTIMSFGQSTVELMGQNVGTFED